MLLNKIQEAIAAYRQWLQTVRHHPHLYKWEALQNFQSEWNLEDADPAAMYDRSLQNSETRRLWQTENWYPKRMMLEFWKFQPRTCRLLFDDLFNETREVDGRIGRLLFGCDELLRDYRRAHPTGIENNHYHGDFRMIMVYLAFRFPDQYSPYEQTVFSGALRQFGARDLPRENDPVRAVKVMRTLMAFLEKDPAVAPALQRHLHPRRHYQGKTLLLADDFCQYVVLNSSKT